MTKTDPEILYGAAAVARFLGLNLKAAQHRIASGDIPTFKIGKTVCARPVALREWLAKAERAAANDNGQRAGGNG